VLSPAPANESDHNKYVRTETAECVVFNDAVHVHRPDEYKRRDTLHQFGHIFYTCTVYITPPPSFLHVNINILANVRLKTGK